MKTVRKSRARGYMLVEMITALTLFSLAGSSLYNGYREGVYCYQRIDLSRKSYSGPKLFFIRLEEDLRNMVVLRDFPFSGAAREISFPAFLPENADKDKNGFRLVQIRYFVEGQELIREEKEITSSLMKPKPRKKILLKDAESVVFRFSYKDEDDERLFKQFWLKDPYPGLPRAVQAEIKTPALDILKTVSIPHGVFGVIPEDEVYP